MKADHHPVIVCQFDGYSTSYSSETITTNLNSYDRYILRVSEFGEFARSTGLEKKEKKKVLPIILSFPKSTRLSVAKQISEVIDQNADHNVPFLLDLVLKCINRPNY